MRYRFMKDDDGHTYLVPADRTEEFERFVVAAGDEALPEGMRELGYHLGCYTFENVRDPDGELIGEAE